MMYTKNEAELLVLNTLEAKALKDPAVAIGFLMSGFKKIQGSDDRMGYVPAGVLRTLYRAAKTSVPANIQESLRRKDKSVEVSRADMVRLAVLAAIKMGADNIADSIIAAERDMPVRRLTTSFPKGSDVEKHTAQLAAEKIAYEKKTIAELKAQGARRIKIKISTVREVANDFTLGEIFRFASYLKMGGEIDLNRSKATPGNAIYICCSDKFAAALENARVPGVGKFIYSGSKNPVWPFDRPASSERELPPWPFPGSGPKPNS